MRVIEVSARKGGVGTTVVACAIAVTLSQKSERVLLVDATKTGDVFAVLGMSIGDDGVHYEASDTLGVIAASPEILSADKMLEYDAIVIDAGVTKNDGRDYWGTKPYVVTVVRNAYLSLRAEVNRRQPSPDALVVVREEGHALTFGDAVSVVGRSRQSLDVPYTADMARAVDAGLFTTRGHLYSWAEAFHPSTTKS